MSFLLQLVYSYVFTPALEYYLIWKTGDNTFVLICSARRELTVVFKREPDPRTVAILRYSLNTARLWFPFIGEVDVYASAEWRLKLQLERQHPVLLPLINDLRKCRQLLTAMQEAQTPKDRKRAATAMMAIAECADEPFMWPVVQEALSARLEEYLQSFTQGVEVEAPVQFFSHHLGWTFTTQPVREMDLEIVCPAKITLLTAAILPDGLEALAAFSERVKQLRHRADIEPLYRALCHDEILACQSLRRMSEEPDARLDKWIHELQSEL